MLKKIIHHLKKGSLLRTSLTYLKIAIPKIFHKIFELFGYELKKINHNNPFIVDVRKIKVHKDNYELYQYTKSNGEFDYEKYKSIQTARNKSKINKFRTDTHIMEYLSKYIKNNISSINFGLCHGTRTGKEQEWFRKYLNCDVIGTEISDTATQFPNTIQWDFHKSKPEWINSVDFIYTNSLDHTYSPDKALNTWMSCIKEKGFLIIEHSAGHSKATETDPFGAHISQMPYLILLWGKGKFYVSEILDMPEEYRNEDKNTKFLIIKNSLKI